MFDEASIVGGLLSDGLNALGKSLDNSLLLNEMQLNNDMLREQMSQQASIMKTAHDEDVLRRGRDIALEGLYEETFLL
ncbi:MAG: hypothetical protein K6F69_06305 [Treponema sp.]|nr:hypothetical protein [Treponema sp.]